MNKRTFNQVRTLIVNTCQSENLSQLCYFYGITKDDFFEFIDDLALIGFKDKYNQHNHPENNKGE